MQLMISLLTLGLFMSPALAHDGHGNVRGAVAASNGGVVHATENFYLEVVARMDGIEIYPFDHDNHPIAPSEMKINGNALVPRTNKSLPVSFAPAGKALASKVDAKDARQYTLELTVSHAGKSETIRLNVGPL